jgi:hypothetical protein
VRLLQRQAQHAPQALLVLDEQYVRHDENCYRLFAISYSRLAIMAEVNYPVA